MLESKPRPPTLKELQNQVLPIGLGILVAFSLWYASYNGWFVFSRPPTPFSVDIIEHSEARTWEQLREENPNMLKDSWHASTTIKLKISTQYLDRVVYAKNLFVFHTEVENTGSYTLWYSSILVFIIDSTNYVRGKYLIQLWSEDNGIKSQQTSDYILYFNVPDDMKGRDFYVKALLYGEVGSSYSPHTELIGMREDDVYGWLPNDWGNRWFLSKTENNFHAYPSLIFYVFQVGSIATNMVFIVALAIMLWASEKIKKGLGTQYGFYLVVIIFIVIFFLIVFLLTSLLF